MEDKAYTDEELLGYMCGNGSLSMKEAKESLSFYEQNESINSNCDKRTFAEITWKLTRKGIRADKTRKLISDLLPLAKAGKE